MQTTAHPLRCPLAGVPLSTGLVVVSLLAACGGPPGAGTPEAQAAGGVRAREIPKVRVVHVERREMTQVLETMTKLESEREIELFPRTAGTVVEITAEEGDHVRAGDVLAMLDDRDQVLAVRDAAVALEEAKNSAELARLAVDEAKARMDSADLAAKQAVRDHERNRKLFEGRETTSSLSESALEASALARETAEHDHRLAILAWQKSQLDDRASATAVERAKVALDRAEVALSYCKVTAPFDGVIAERRIRVGDSAGTGQAAFVLTDPSHLRTVFRRPQEELPMFRLSANGTAGAALEVTATAEALPGERFRGEVLRVSPTIDPDSGQFRVTARLHPEEEGDSPSSLLPGMLVRLEIVTDRHPEALVIPKRALRREGERRYVFVVEPLAPADGGAAKQPGVKSSRGGTVRTIRRVDIEEGYGDDDDVEVIALGGDPLRENIPIVLVGSRDLEDGDLVDIGGEAETSGPSPAADGDVDGLAEADARRSEDPAGSER